MFCFFVCLFGWLVFVVVVVVVVVVVSVSFTLIEGGDREVRD